MKKIFILLTALFLSHGAYAGPRVVGNGGDVYALQFVTFAQKVLLYLHSSNIEGLDIEGLRKSIDSAKVESTTDSLKLNGMDKDAINYPSENRIVFNRDRWSSLMTDERLALVLHEYLGLLGREDANYAYSKFLLKDMTTTPQVSPGVGRRQERFEFQGSLKWNLTSVQFYNGCSDKDKKELLSFTDSGALAKCYQKYNNCRILFNRITYAVVPYDANHGSVCDASSIALGQ